MTEKQLKLTYLAAQYEACRTSTREHARTFYFASHVLPREKRMAAYAVYAFCRRVDDLVDTASSSGSRTRALRKLRWLRAQLDHLYKRREKLDAEFLALQETVFRYDIPQAYFLDLLRGVEMDLTKKQYATFAELKEYCYCVASVVGLIMTKIFGSAGDEALRYAADLGTAMQLTNILRDIREDFAMGRVYLPADELKRFGVSEEDLAKGIMHERFREFMRFQIRRARGYYARAAKGIPLLTGDGSRFCVRLMSGTYSGILDAIEQMGYDVFVGRAYVPFLSKLGIAARTVLPFAKNIEEQWKTVPAKRVVPRGQES